VLARIGHTRVGTTLRVAQRGERQPRRVSARGAGGRFTRPGALQLIPHSATVASVGKGALRVLVWLALHWVRFAVGRIWSDVSPASGYRGRARW
jgi:hypothetical protein